MRSARLAWLVEYSPYMEMEASTNIIMKDAKIKEQLKIINLLFFMFTFAFPSKSLKQEYRMTREFDIKQVPAHNRY